jgi:hypothetical protein
MDWGFNIVVNFPQIDLQIQCDAYQNPSRIFVEIKNLTLKFILKKKLEFNLENVHYLILRLYSCSKYQNGKLA